MSYTVLGGGAIGGTLAFHLARAGHSVLVVDADPAHVAAIRSDGLTLVRGEERLVAPVEAAHPDEIEPVEDGGFGRVLLAVKATATDGAASWLADRLAPDGFVVSVQNGLNEERIAAYVGERRTVGAFVNLFADVVEPGAIRDGGPGALVVGEPAGAVTPRVESVVADLQAWGPARATDNVAGYLWSKLGFGAMLTATALADAPMADLIDRHRGLMVAVAREIYAVSDALGIALEPFDAFDPRCAMRTTPAEEATGQLDALVAWLRTQAKDRSGIWRDIAVRKRRTEVHDHYRPVVARARELGLEPAVLPALLDRLEAIEAGRMPMSEDNLTELEGHL